MKSISEGSKAKQRDYQILLTGSKEHLMYAVVFVCLHFSWKKERVEGNYFLPEAKKKIFLFFFD